MQEGNNNNGRVRSIHFSIGNPVLYTPVDVKKYSEWLSKEMENIFQAYRSISKVICLDQNYRQVIDGQANADYLAFLSRLRKGETTEDDVALVQSRCYSKLSNDERKEFEDAIWAFPTNCNVNKRNK